MNLQIQNNVFDAIYILFKTLSDKQKIKLLKKLNFEIPYKKEIIDSRNESESYLFKGDDFEKFSENILKEEKIIDIKKFKV
ncbi:MAG: hypothetical protein B6I24_10725 [Bacteroidetes bacterium 4572_128]|nr:MAG: hypothetical protein B6I24_10725 [Bacteroidetes bacterium 4572_128]